MLIVLYSERVILKLARAGYGAVREVARLAICCCGRGRLVGARFDVRQVPGPFETPLGIGARCMPSCAPGGDRSRDRYDFDDALAFFAVSPFSPPSSAI